jgi:hypothetical protein
MERNGTMPYSFTGQNWWREITYANAERIAQLRIVGALAAVIGMRRALVIVVLLLRQVFKRMVQRMRGPGLHGKQQDEGKQQR